MLRLSLLTGIYSALVRHDEVLAAVSASADRDEANAAVRSLLGLDRTQADAVLTLGWDRLTADSIQQIAEEIANETASVDADPRDTSP
jgi:DNA gyrase/topoisomerase IV subunit A